MTDFDPDDFHPRVGARVLTADGEMVGSVTQVLPDHFRVDAPMESDYWLSKAALAAVEEDIVRLDFDRPQLDAFKLADPASRSTSPILDEQLDARPPTVEHMSTNSPSGNHAFAEEQTRRDKPASSGRRLRWPWLVVGLLALAGVAGATFMRRRRKPQVEEEEQQITTAVPAVVLLPRKYRRNPAA